MEKEFSYVTKLDIKHKHFDVIDIPQMVKECTDKWFNQTLTQVNGSVVRVGIVEGEYHWHKHDNEDDKQFWKADIAQHRYSSFRSARKIELSSRCTKKSMLLPCVALAMIFL